MRLLFATVLVLVGCNTTQTRTVQGRLTGTSAQAVVFTETTSGEQTATQAGPDGTFTLQVPTGQPVTMLVAVPNGTAKVSVLRHVGPAWFTLKPGPTIVLGQVRPAGTPVEQLDPVGQTTPQQCPSTPGEADLPYDAKLSLGQTWRLAEAFAEKGPQPARVIDVTMEGSSWRLAELKSGAAFTVTQADCDHVGNRDTGRDRAFITWENADGSKETDHLDMRYCEGGGEGGGGGGSSSPTEPAEVDDCDDVLHEGCGSSGSSCDDDDELEPVEVPGGMTCPAQGPTAPPQPR